MDANCASLQKNKTWILCIIDEEVHVYLHRIIYHGPLFLKSMSTVYVESISISLKFPSADYMQSIWHFLLFWASELTIPTWKLMLLSLSCIILRHMILYVISRFYLNLKRLFWEFLEHCLHIKFSNYKMVKDIITELWKMIYLIVLNDEIILKFSLFQFKSHKNHLSNTCQKPRT